jgi:WD40 repeat protein/tRNA A-37 threonylcarbamoyl transferase component Bud32
MQGNTLNCQGANAIIGKILGDRFQIIKHLGGGGFGQTYLAEDLKRSSNLPCVVKQLKPKSCNPETLQTARALFQREVEALYLLGNHPQIPRLIDDFEEDEQFYLVQEFIEGSELKQELPVGQQLSEAQVIRLLQEILQILEFVHDQGVIHRDVKPSNLIRRQQDGQLVLIDFGAVKQVSTHITDTETQTTLTVAIGSPGFMPNEQLGGKPRFCSDIYAVGMLGIQAVTGIPANQLPEDPRTSEIIWRVKEALPVDVDIKVSPQLAHVLDKMVRYDYRQRYQSATEALQALTALNHCCPSVPSDASATYTLTKLPASAQTTATATLHPQTSSSRRQIIPGFFDTPSHTQVKQETHKVGVVTSEKTFKLHKLKGFGIGVVTTVALTAGISYVPNFKDLSINSLLPSKQNYALVKTLTGHSKQVNAIAVTPDGRTLVTGCVDNTVKLWNLPDGKPLLTLSGHSDKVKSIAISSDGQTIASGSGDKTIKLWNLKTGKLLRTLGGHSSYVLSVAFSPNGQTLISSSADKSVQLWDVGTGKLLQTLSGHSGWVYSIAISSDGQTLATASDDRTIKLWHLPTGKLMGTLPEPSGNVVRSVMFSPDGKTLISGSFNKIHLWNVENLQAGCQDGQSCSPAKTFSARLGVVNAIAITPDGQTLASGSKDKTIKLWNLKTGQLKETISEVSDEVHSLTFTPDGKTLVSGGSEDGSIEIWRAR